MLNQFELMWRNVVDNVPLLTVVVALSLLLAYASLIVHLLRKQLYRLGEKQEVTGLLGYLIDEIAKSKHKRQCQSLKNPSNRKKVNH